jgi:hypothetical protein
LKKDWQVMVEDSVVANPDHVRTRMVDVGGMVPNMQPRQTFSRASLEEENGIVSIIGERDDERDSEDCLMLLCFSGGYTPAYGFMSLWLKFRIRIELEHSVKRQLACHHDVFAKADNVWALVVMSPGDKIVVKLTCTPPHWWQCAYNWCRGIELVETRTIEYHGSEPFMRPARRTPGLASMVGAGNGLFLEKLDELDRIHRTSGEI